MIGHFQAIYSVMTETQLVPYRLKNISPKAYEHPADRAATAALKSVPMLDAVVRRLIEFQYERAFRQLLLANSVKLGPDQLPDLYSGFDRALEALDMPDTYDLYLTQFPYANAAAVGAGKPMVLLNSELVQLLDEEELRGVFGHEIGHILSDHVLYETALLILLQIAAPAGLPALGGLPLLAVRSALLEWSRAAELSADRASVLVTRDPLVTCRVLMVLAGGLSSRELNLDAFLRQATEYHEWESGWDKISRFLVERQRTHGYPVRRLSELMKWIQSGAYDRIVGGAYPVRGEEADPRVEAGDAVAYYTRRFKAIFREAGEGVERAGGKLAEWLRRD
jgi:Zn-dependent protease with chaperone function